MGLKGTIAHWVVGDVIDFLNTNVTSALKTGNELTVTYADNKTATYQLARLESHTTFKLQPDGHGGTELTLVHIVGVAHAQPDLAG